MIFQTIARQRIDDFAEFDALQADIQLLAAAQMNAEAVQASRRTEIEKLDHDLAGFTKDAQTIEGYAQALQTRLAEVDVEVQQGLATLRDRAAELAQAQLDILRRLNESPAQSP
jgi:hypothetical protein